MVGNARPSLHTGGVPRPRLLLAAALSVALASGLTVAATPAAAVNDGWRAHMIRKVNEVRAAAGVAPVRWCRALETSAQQYAVTLGRAGVVEHIGPDGASLSQRVAAAGYRPRAAAENLAGGQRTVVQVMRAWRASPSHYASLVDPRLTDIGFGYAESPSTRYGTYWVQHLGTGGSCR